jgi:hypothetical protein
LSFATPRENYLYNFCYLLEAPIMSDAGIGFDIDIESDGAITIGEVYYLHIA